LFQDYLPTDLICCLHNCSFALFPLIIHSTPMITRYLAQTITDLLTEALRYQRHPFRCITLFLAFTFSPFLCPIYIFLILLLPNNDQNQCLLICRLQQPVNSTCQVLISNWPFSFHESLSADHHQVALWIFLCLNTVLPTIVLWDWVNWINPSPLPTGT
jgi:hypothetical protein